MTAASPIRDNVGAALRFVRAHWRFVIILAAIGAAASAVLTAIASAAPGLGPPAVIAAMGVQAFVYAAFTAAFLAGIGAARADWLRHGWRVWAAMAVIGFFLFIVFFVISIPVMIMLFAGPLGRYAQDLESAGPDQAAVMAVLTRFAEENPVSLLLVMLFYAAIWLYLTSRLYLAAPATVDQRRILTFETWSWTKHDVWRIVAARLLLLVAANILAGALGYLGGALVGIDPLMPDPGAGVAYIVYTLLNAFSRLALYFSLEAALSASLYRHLKAPGAAPK